VAQLWCMHGFTSTVQRFVPVHFARSKRHKAAKITTIEGLGGNHPQPAGSVDKIRAFHNAVTASRGQIMQAAALLRSNPKPSDADIDQSMSGNICRWRNLSAYQSRR